MGGKALLIVILGFNVIFMIAGLNYNSASTRAVDNDVDFFYENKLNNLALSGANIALNHLAVDNSWSSGFQDLQFDDGLIDINITAISGVEKKIECIAKLNGKQKTITLVTRPGSFADFANYTEQWPGNGYLGTGDTIFGRFHTQGKLNLKGKPVFMGPASARLGLRKLDSKTSPEFHPGFKEDDIPLDWEPNATLSKAQSAGHVFSESSGKPLDVRIKFNDNGTITYSQKINNSSWSSEATEPLSTFAPNGILYVSKGNVYIEGTVSGKITLVAENSSGNGSGNVFIENDVLLKNDPRTNPASTDMLGIICSNDIKIVDNPANHNDINIFAAIFSHKGGLTLENNTSGKNGMPSSGYLTVYGSLTEQSSKITGYANSSGIITNGYNQKIYYDNRFKKNPPENFPLTGKLELQSWLE